MAVNVEEKLTHPNKPPITIITSDKFKHTFTVEPDLGGYVFYVVKASSGQLPVELKGKYTRMSAAVDAVKRYEQRVTKTPTVVRDEKAEKRNAAKVQRERTEHVHSGSDN